MSTVYRKTDKGHIEIGTRSFGLSPRLRQALILVDGRRTERDLATLILHDSNFVLAALLSDGFIDSVSNQVDLHLEPAAAPHHPALPLDALKREAARYLIDKLGPFAEGLAIKLEGAKSLPEVQPLLVTALKALQGAGRSKLADEFMARFLTPLQR